MANASPVLPLELESRMRALRSAVNAVANPADRDALRKLVATLDETLESTKAYWEEVHQDTIDNQTSHFFLVAKRFTGREPFQ